MERFADEAAEPIAAVGGGIVYDRTHDGRPLRRSLSPQEREELKARYYDPRWMALRGAARGKVLIDLHSYPLRPWEVEPSQEAERPEIDLGIGDVLTPSC